MIEEINQYLSRYLYLGEDEKNILAAWVLHTWQFDYTQPIVTPYIYINSKGPGSGKSTTIEVLSTLARNAMATVSITPSALFRIITDQQPSLMLDEIDTVFHGRKNEDMRGVLNSGHKRGGFIPRVNGSTVIKYETYCPKLLAGIYNAELPKTIQERCVPIILSVKPEDVNLDYFASFLVGEESEILLDKIVNWSEDNNEKVSGYEHRQLAGMSPRQSDAAWPLLAIGAADGIDLLPSIKRLYDSFAETYKSDENKFLQKIANLFDFDRTDRIHLSDMLVAFELPNNLSGTKKLSAMIAEYGVEAKNVRIGTFVHKGYKIEQFKQVFKANGVVLKNITIL